MNYRYLNSPIGKLRLLSNGNQLVRIEFQTQYHLDPADTEANDSALAACYAQLDEYFAGRRETFDVPMAPEGTAFQRQVWEALKTIPYGHTRSYSDVARQIGRDRAVRAVGAANGRNPIPVIVPCHRVIGSDGKLTGFAGGLEAKRSLLRLEAAG
ncbi:MAG: methylated-DNA--[protein]-cysteine S-methyltransferase [Pseudomonadota bacterium]